MSETRYFEFIAFRFILKDTWRQPKILLTIKLCLSSYVMFLDVLLEIVHKFDKLFLWIVFSKGNLCSFEPKLTSVIYNYFLYKDNI